jgi:putative ABC transport system permease protein
MGWRRFFHRRRWDAERAREIESYMEFETADNLARGMNPGEARRAACRKLGNRTLIREEIYRMNSIGWMELLFQDLRYGFRVLRKSPGFSLVAVLSLALGIGATTAIFSVVYGVLISPYPYAHPNEIWAPQVRDLRSPRRGFTSYHLSDYLELSKLPAFSSAMGTSYENELLTGDHPPENFSGVLLTPNAFQFLGVAPVLGRTILPSDVKPGGEPEPVVVLSYLAWQHLFDGSPDALGRTLVLNDRPRTVIGVMPPRFGWYTNNSGWLPMPLTLRDDIMVNVIMRLRPGLSPEAAAQQLQVLNLQLAKVHPGNFPKNGFTTALINYMDVTVAAGEMRSSLRLLFGAVGFLLLIACANVANLQMARAASRAHEIAVRMSVGAARARVFRQLLTESMALSLAGGALGVLFAVAITRTIVALMPEFYVPNEARITVNAYVLLFSAAVSVFTGILFGLAPALRCSRPDLVEALKDAGRSTAAGAAGGKTRGLLVIAEVSLSVVLLVGASLAIRSFANLQKVDPGFQPGRVLMVGLPVPPKRYATYEQRIAFTQAVLERVEAIPGVESAAIGNGGLPFGGAQSPFSIEGHPLSDARRIMIGLVSPGYAQTLGIPLRAGRSLSKQEVVRADPVALINEAAAKLWPAGESPIGAHMRLDILAQPAGALVPPNNSPDVTVIGILADTRNDGLRNPPAPAAFVPYTLVAPTDRMLAIRSRAQPMLLLNAVRAQLRAVDKDQPLGRPMTLEEVLGFETVQPRFNMALFGFFGMMGLAIAAIGIYSVLSYTVARRTHEIGVRMALGAERRHVLNLVLRMGGRLVLTGLATGLLGSMVLAKILRSEVFQVPATDPMAILGVVLILSAAALVACLAPARRAARLDPLAALRHD